MYTNIIYCCFCNFYNKNINKEIDGEWYSLCEFFSVFSKTYETCDDVDKRSKRNKDKEINDEREEI